MSILNNITEGRYTGPPRPEASMTVHRAGARKRRPTHPGVVLDNALTEAGLNPNSAGKRIGVTPMSLHNVIKGGRVSAEMALRLGKLFGNGARLWIDMQSDVDLWDAQEKLRAELAKIETVKVTDPT